MIFTSLVLLALTLFVAWDSSQNAGRPRLSAAPQASNHRKLGFARRPWSLALSTVASANARIGNELKLTPVYCRDAAGRASSRHALQKLRVPALGGRRIWNLSMSGDQPDERSKA